MPNQTQVYTSVDCTDCPILEPYPFDSTWWSHKINGPALKYEVCTAIANGFIVHISGPHKASKHDVTVFNENLVNKLLPGECTEADGGYGATDAVKTPLVAKSCQARVQKAKVCARGEVSNSRFKQWGALTRPFRQSHQKHKLVFYTIVVVTQLGYEHGTLNIPFDVEFDAMEYL